LLVTSTSYLSIITGELTTFQILLTEIAALAIITIINIMGVKVSGFLETILTFIKVVPLIVLPCLFLFFFDPELFSSKAAAAATTTNHSVLESMAQTALITFWGFLGLECATTPAESVKNPKKTIPRAIIIGTICVALVYIANTVSIIGVTGFEVLETSNTPYATAMKSILGFSSDIAISIMAIIVCMGTLNAWTLTSAHIALGACKDKLFPRFLGSTNKYGAPVSAIIVSSIGMIPFLIVEQSGILKGGLSGLVDLMVSVFVIVYLVCCASYIRIVRSSRAKRPEKTRSYAIAIFSSMFCIFILSQDTATAALVFVIFILLGLPIYLRNRELKPA
jgi:APA family basic amino acid/polyamine antiporter